MITIDEILGQVRSSGELDYSAVWIDRTRTDPGGSGAVWTVTGVAVGYRPSRGYHAWAGAPEPDMSVRAMLARAAAWGEWERERVLLAAGWFRGNNGLARPPHTWGHGDEVSVVPPETAPEDWAHHSA